MGVSPIEETFQMQPMAESTVGISPGTDKHVGPLSDKKPIPKGKDPNTHMIPQNQLATHHLKNKRVP